VSNNDLLPYDDLCRLIRGEPTQTKQEPPPKNPTERKGWRLWNKKQPEPARLDVTAEVQRIADKALTQGQHMRDIARSIDTVADRIRQRACMSLPLDSSIF
jgi:hypothetical protein